MRLLMIILTAVSGLANAFPRGELYLYSPKGDKTWKGVSPEVSFVDGGIWVGKISDLSSPQRFVPHMITDLGYTDPNSTGLMTFDSIGRNLRIEPHTAFIFENKTEPVYFNPDYSSTIPPEGSAHGFEVSKKGEITFKGQNKFVGCRDDPSGGNEEKITFKVYWQGDRAAKDRDGNECRPLAFRMKLK